MKRFSTHKRAGFTLLEVLIATSVIMVGIFGIASAIALSEQLFKTSFRADMAANCGRAALKTMLAQDFLDEFDTDSSTTGNETTFTRTLKTCNWTPGTTSSLTLSDEEKEAADFECMDHLRQNNSGIDLEENPPNYDTTLKSDYAWVGTIQQISSEYCEVSAAVAYKPERGASQAGYVTAKVTSISDDMGVVRAQIGNANVDDLERLIVGQYVFLCSGSEGHWYRIDSFYDGQMELHGPQWTSSSGSGDIYTPGGVIAVYTQIVPIQTR